MYRKNVRLLSIFNFLIGFSLFAPLAIIYFSKVSGSYTLGASIFGIAMLSSSIFEIPTGLWSDHVGRKQTIILGSWARLICFLLYAIGQNYWWLVGGAIFEGLSRSFYSGNNNAFLYDTLAGSGMEKDYGEYLGKVSSTEQLALGISALIGGIIASFSFTYLVWLAVLVQIGVLYISYKFTEPKSRKKLNSNPYSDLKSAVLLFASNKKLRLLSIASVIDFSFSEMMYQFRAAFISMVWPIWAIGLANVLSNFGATASFYFSGRILKRFKALSLLLFQTVWGKAVGLISYGFPTVISPLLMSTGSLLFGVGMVAENKLMQAEFTDHQRATMQSLNSLAGSIGFAIMSIVLGSMADSMTPARALLVLNCVSIPIIYCYWLLFKHDKNQVLLKAKG